MKQKAYILLLVVLVGSAFFAPQAHAQNEVTITLVVSDFMQDFITDDVIQRFEDANPGIQVQVKTSPQANFFGSAASGIDDYLSGAADYVSSGDVVYLGSNTLSPEATRAGYFLDLKPLVQADTALNTADFYPVAWDSYQWDNGLWAIPTSLDVVILSYDPAAFDAAGLPYPNSAWTMDDLANAARALTQKDATGAVTQAGLTDFGGYLPYLLRSLAGTGFYTDDPLAASPTFANPALESLLNTWVDLKNEGAIGGFEDGMVFIIGGGDGSPMSLTQSFGLSSGPNQETVILGSLLPGNKAGVIAQGFGVSAGTLTPEASYKLAKFLSEQPEVANTFQSVSPARTSLVGVETQGQGGPGGGGRGFRGNFSAENQAVIDSAIVNGLSLSQMRYADYLSLAVTKIQEGADAITALQEIELEAVSNLQTAAAKRDEGVVTVATPVPEVQLAPGEIALNFGIVSFVSPLPNQQAWDQLAADFAASDPEVGVVNLDTARDNDLDTLTSEYECFYMTNNAVQGGDVSSLLDLTPFMRDDLSIDENDFIGNTLAQVQVDNKYYALPISILPEVLNLNTDIFAQYGATLPADTWTVDTFVDTLQTLKPTPDDAAPFVTGFSGDNTFLMLIAAFGGLPIDYRTSPPTINFTDPTTLEAIRQVLDLAKNGYIQYDGLSQFGGGGGAVLMIGGTESENAITPQSSGLPRFGGPNGNTTSYLTNYPRGSQYVPISYDMGTAYISINAQNPAACYRWISTLASRQDLFTNMPARHSLIENPTLAVNVGESNIASYRNFATVMEDTSAVAFPSPFGAGDAGSFVLRQWLYQAFDAYVLEEADLATELADAQMMTVAYQECIAGIPPYDASTGQSRQDYFQEIMGCVTRVDPSFGQ